jgi:hypothetical protein
MACRKLSHFLSQAVALSQCDSHVHVINKEKRRRGDQANKESRYLSLPTFFFLTFGLY